MLVTYKQLSGNDSSGGIMRTLRFILKAAIFINLCLFTLAAADARTEVKSAVNAGSCKLPDIQIDDRPGPTDRPTEVTVGFRLLDVTAIEDTSQSITADFIISQTWKDARLTAFEGCQFSLSEVWNPQIDIINAGRLFTRLPKRVDVLESGRVRYIQRFQGSLVFRYDAHKFPFDRHNILISLGSLGFGEKDVRLIIDEDFTGRTPNEPNVADWKISKVQAEIFSEYFFAFRQNHSVFAFNILTERRSAYYVWKVILPLMLIVMMSWTVFWIDPSQLSAQIGMSATSMLTLIAFQFAMANILPKLSYYTLLDRFIMGSTVLVFLSLTESVTTTHLAIIQKPKLAIRIDHLCRWAFPAAFVAFTLIVFSV
jgi:hypothetical protein